MIFPPCFTSFHQISPHREKPGKHWKIKKNPAISTTAGLFFLAEKEGFEASKNVGISMLTGFDTGFLHVLL